MLLIQFFLDDKSQKQYSFPQSIIEKKNKNYALFYFLGRNYPHKNIKKLIKLFEALNNSEAKCLIALTLNPDEVRDLGLVNSEYLINLGEVEIKYLPSFIDFFDSYISLSDNECFSVGPLEALFMNKRVFLNKRKFFEETINENAFYIDSDDLNFSKKEILKNLKSKKSTGLDFLNKFHPNIRWKKYKQIINNELL